MTRLKEDDLANLSLGLAKYDLKLQKFAGTGLAGIAAEANHKKNEYYDFLRKRTSVAVVPLTYGQGIIGGFAQSVCEITSFLGFSSLVTSSENLAGLSEAVNRSAEVIFMGDDDKFLAFNRINAKTADNGEATGRGYAAALALAAKDINDKEVLIIGAGPVGSGAAHFLLARGAHVFVHDLDSYAAEKLRQELPQIEIISSLAEGMKKCSLLLEATPAAAVLPSKMLRQDMLVAAPGVPLGLEREGEVFLGERVLHDVLEIGVASMLFTVLS